MFSFPPHCSHKLQPLDVGVYGPFKNYLNRTQGTWMINHPGKTMKIYDIPGMVKDSLPQALNPVNIMSGFEATGIWSLNENIFQDSDFVPSFVTDRPNPVNPQEPSNSSQNVSDLTFDLETAEILEFDPEQDISGMEIIQEVVVDVIPNPSNREEENNEYRKEQRKR